MSKPHVAIYGPLSVQYQRVLDRLPREIREQCRFDLLATDTSNWRVTTADLHVVWRRFASHRTTEGVRARGGCAVWVSQWNVGTLLEALRRIGVGTFVPARVPAGTLA